MTSIKRLAKEYKDALNRLDGMSANEREDIKDIGHADVSRRYSRLALTQRVQEARAHGRTWDQIALVLGTTKQAARERFGS